MTTTGHLDRAYDALNPDHARAYRLLGVLPFAADIDTAMLAAACPATPGQAEDALRALHDADLLGHGDHHPVRGQTYRMTDAVWAHAHDHAGLGDTDDGEDEAVRRLLDWYLTVCTTVERRLTPSHRADLARTYLFPPDPELVPVFTSDEAALSWIDAQHPNLMEGIRTAAASGLHATAWQLVHAIWPWWHLIANYPLWFEAHHLGIAAAQADADSLAEQELTNTLAVGLRNNHRHDEAIEMFARVLAMATAAGDPRGRAQALHELGTTHHGAGRLDQATPFLHQARELRAMLGYRRGVALTMIVQGLVALDRHDTDTALELLAAARSLLLEEGDPFDAARALAWLGHVHALRDNHDRGDEYVERAQSEFRTAGSPRWIARTEEMRGQNAEHRGDVCRARHHYQQAADLYADRPLDLERVTARLNNLPPAHRAPDTVG